MAPATSLSILETHRELLRQLGAGEVDHYGRPLLDHLEGTHLLLRQWGNPDEICVAGLFHAVYGTERLDSSRLGVISRSKLGEAIGERSEEFAFLFGIADRRLLLTENILPPHQIVCRDTGEAVAISPGTLSALMEIGVANLVEQMPHLPVAAFRAIREEVGLFQGMQDYLSGPAGRALFMGFAQFEDRHRATS